ncbi:type I-C CRISPR-associated protein Cas8c/Csd1 [bacterium]|nr:type I-C CRISPR-associated protein Cas8c/Csd1 [bacterium]
MILQALYKLAEREHLRPDPDYEYRPVAWLVRVGPGGRFLGIEGTKQPPVTGKGKPVAKSFLLPRTGGRTSGDRAFFFFDKAEYVFGIDPDPKSKREPDKLKLRASLFRQEVSKCFSATGDEAAGAVLAFLEQVAAGLKVELLDGCAPNDLFAFIYSKDQNLLVTDRPDVKAYWKKQRAVPVGSATACCLVTGDPCEPGELFPGLKRVPGGSTSGVALVSFNAPAFESYGWQSNANASVSRDAAEACATALNRLLDPDFPDPYQPGQSLPRRSLRLSADTVVCYWSADTSGDDFCCMFGGLLEANPELVGETYRSVWRGKPPRVEDTSAFYALLLSGAQGRAIVRGWIESSLAEAVANLSRWFEDLNLVRAFSAPSDSGEEPPLSLRTLLRSLAAGGEDKNIPPPLAGQLFQGALKGTPLPFSILQKALERTRAEIGRLAADGLEGYTARQRQEARAALIKAVLNGRKRIHPQTTPYPEVLPEMDANNTNPGYLLGRLMAVIERMQQLALGEVNASVVDRFFSGASATPAVVFPRLLKNLRHHASKAKDNERSRGSATWLERQVDDILAGLSGFPPHLSLEEQGLFVLGYHQQRHQLWKKRGDSPEPPAGQAGQ